MASTDQHDSIWHEGRSDTNYANNPTFMQAATYLLIAEPMTPDGGWVCGNNEDVMHDTVRLPAGADAAIDLPAVRELLADLREPKPMVYFVDLMASSILGRERVVFERYERRYVWSATGRM